MTCEPVGLFDIAARLGVKLGTAHAWRRRKLLPEPDWTVSGDPAWEWGRIVEWAKATGRL